MSTKTTITAPRRRGRQARNVSVEIQSDPQQAAKTARNRQRRRNKKAMNRMNKARLPVVTTNTRLRPCTAEYAVALVDPFGSRQTMPCIPDSIVLPSAKFQTKARATLTNGTAGTGFVLFDPWKMAYNNGALVNTWCDNPIIYTNGAYAGASLINYTVNAGAFAVAGVTSSGSNSPYSQADFTANGRQLRLVAAGLRVTYTGSSFRNQGRLLLFRSQSNASYPTIIQSGTLLNDNYTSVMTVSRKSEYTFYTPDNHDYIAYHPLTDYFGSNANSHFAYGILVDGADGTAPQSWFIEAIAYFEIVGPGLTLSKSHSDVEGMGLVHESLPVKNPVVTPTKVAGNVLTKVSNALIETGRELIPMALKYGVPALTSIASGNPTPLLTSFAANNYQLNMPQNAYVEEID